MKNTTPKLEREQLQEVDLSTCGAEIKELAIKSQAVLGYKLLRSIVAKPKSLREVLRELNIAPFSKRSVELYKDKMLVKARAELKRNKDVDNEAHWRTTRIDLYKDAIPESIIRQAIQIKEALPEVRLEIEQLTIAKPDPFLKATHNGVEFYVAVWDEPHFEDAILRGAHISRANEFDDDDD